MAPLWLAGLGAPFVVARLRDLRFLVTLLGTTWSGYAMAYENGKVIALCEGVMPPLGKLWPELKNFS